MIRMKYGVRILLAGAVFLPAVVKAEEAPKKNWKNVAEMSAVSTNGNSKASSYSTKEKYTYNWTKTGLELSGLALGSQTKGETTAEKYNAGEKLTYNLTEKNYLYQKFLWEKDRFAGIRNRYDNSVGVGRELLSKPKDTLNGELGGGYITEERIGSKANNFAAARAFAKYVRKISETANFLQTAEYLQSLKFGDDFRVNTESAITAGISAHMLLKLSYVWNYVAQPPNGFGRNDTIATAALVVNY